MLIQIIILFLCSSGINIPILIHQQNNSWQVPESANKLKNPTDSNDKDNLDIGYELYMQYCRSCHGKTGLGDGPQAKNLPQKLINFSSEEFQSQTDGSLYYKISTGRGLMPGFSKRIREDEDRWLVVNYIRTLSQE